MSIHHDTEIKITAYTQKYKSLPINKQWPDVKKALNK